MTAAVPTFPSADAPAAPGASPAVLATALAAVALPVLLAYNLPPSSTFLNQALALAGWGVFAATLAAGLPRAVSTGLPWGLGALALTGGLLMGAVLVSMGAWGLPSGLGLSSLGLIGAAMLVAWVGSAVQRAGQGAVAYDAFAKALVAAGIVSVGIAVVQYFFPAWADGDFIARASTPSRVGANLRQPNHLSSLLLASMAALVWLHDARERADSRVVLARVATTCAMLLLTFGIVLTVSRTGAVCVVILAAWGVLDGRLSRFSRRLLVLTPLVFAAGWYGVDAWSSAVNHAFAGDSQLHKSDLSSSRFGIWSNTLSLVGLHPWTGVGWGEFNFAWTLTPFPGRPVAFFDHTHNLPLQLLVELGRPAAAVVVSSLVVALAWAIRAAFCAVDDDLPAVRCSLVMVLMMGVHSLLEYPLWYAYFLLPTVFAFGIAVGGRDSADGTETSGRHVARPALLLGGMVLAAGAAFSVVDYMKVVRIFAPTTDSPPLDQRIEEGRRSVFFAHHAEYAAVTTAANPSAEMRGFDVAAHYLLDARLMIAWSKALAEQGDLERARYVAQRLKEFRHAEGDKFFAACDEPSAQPLPFQCSPPTRTFTYEDFRGGR